MRKTSQRTGAQDGGRPRKDDGRKERKKEGRKEGRYKEALWIGFLCILHLFG